MKKIFLIFILVIAMAQFGSSLELSVDVLSDYLDVESGQSVYFKVGLVDKAVVGRHDVSIRYEIFFEDMLIHSSEETKAVETQASFIKSIKTNDNYGIGIHKIVVSSGNYSASTLFNIKRAGFDSQQIYPFLVMFVVFVVGLLIWWEVHKVRKRLEKK